MEMAASVKHSLVFTPSPETGSHLDPGPAAPVQSDSPSALFVPVSAEELHSVGLMKGFRTKGVDVEGKPHP